MARRTTKPADPPRRPALTMSRHEANAKLTSRIEKSIEIRQTGSGGDIVQARQDYDDWHSFNVQLLGRMFTVPSIAEEYRYCAPGRVLNLAGPTIIAEYELRAELLESIDANVVKLRQLREQLELFDEPSQPAAQDAAFGRTPSADLRRAAFIVHGHDEGAREATARVLQQLGIEPIILHERPNEGRTILEKIEAHADVPFAVVLLTPDDVGGESRDKLRPRARQNVILELGFFWGRLSRSRVCVLYREGVELPSDLGGLVYVKMDDGRGWRFNLAEELDAAGLRVDFNLLRGS